MLMEGLLISATVLPDFDGPRKMPVHGTRGTTGSEGCLLVYSVVGKSGSSGSGLPAAGPLAWHGV